MRVFRALFALVVVMGWLNENATVTCGRPRTGYPACPMHGSADTDAGSHFETANRGACHDSGAAAHCSAGPQCSIGVEALSPGTAVVRVRPQVQGVSAPPAAVWRSFCATPQGPPPRASNRTA